MKNSAKCFVSSALWIWQKLYHGAHSLTWSLRYWVNYFQKKSGIILVALCHHKHKYLSVCYKNISLIWLVCIGETALSSVSLKIIHLIDFTCYSHLEKDGNFILSGRDFWSVNKIPSHSKKATLGFEGWLLLSGGTHHQKYCRRVHGHLCIPGRWSHSAPYNMITNALLREGGNRKCF